LELKNIWIEKTIVSKHESHKIDISGVLHQITLLENLLIKTYFLKNVSHLGIMKSCWTTVYCFNHMRAIIFFQTKSCNNQKWVVNVYPNGFSCL